MFCFAYFLSLTDLLCIAEYEADTHVTTDAAKALVRQRSPPASAERQLNHFRSLMLVRAHHTCTIPHMHHTTHAPYHTCTIPHMHHTTHAYTQHNRHKTHAASCISSVLPLCLYLTRTLIYNRHKTHAASHVAKLLRQRTQRP